MRSSTNASLKAVTVASLCTLFACGGSSTSQQAPNDSLTIPNSGMTNPNLGIDYRDYAPFRESTTRTFTGGTYSTVVTGNVIGFRWGKTVEGFRIVGNWVCLDTYLNDGEKEPYRIRTTKAEMSVDGGPWTTVIHPCEGQPYSLVTFDKPYSLRVWGYVEHIPYFWQHVLTPVAQVRNTCWTGENNVRDALEQKEVWHDAVRGWEPTRGTGTLKDGIPTGEGITYTWFQTIAKGAGPLWTSTTYCLVR